MKKCYVFGHTFEETPKREYYKFACTQCERKSDNPKSEKFENTFWESNEWEIIRATLITLVVFAVLLFTIVSLRNHACMIYQELQINTMYNPWTGCMAKHQVYGWVPVEKYFEILNVIVK